MDETETKQVSFKSDSTGEVVWTLPEELVDDVNEFFSEAEWAQLDKFFSYYGERFMLIFQAGLRSGTHAVDFFLRLERFFQELATEHIFTLEQVKANERLEELENEEA